jgi:hypothetical protein
VVEHSPTDPENEGFKPSHHSAPEENGREKVCGSLVINIELLSIFEDELKIP